MLVDLVLAVAAFYFMIPLVAGYFAHSYGRSFWLWFTISTFLPIITHFILIGLVYYDEHTTKPDSLNRREQAEADRLVKGLIESMPELQSGKNEKENTPSVAKAWKKLWS